MFKYLKKYWLLCILAPLFMVGEIAMDLIQPDMMAKIVDEGVLGGNMPLIIETGIKMILLVAFGAFCGIMCGVFATFAAQKFGNDVRKDLFSRIMSLSFEQTDHITTGSLVTRLTNDVTQVQNMVMMAIRGFVRCIVMFVGGIYMLYNQSVRFAFVAACGLPFVIFFVVFFLRKTAPLFSKVQKKIDRISSLMQETVAGARVVKAYVKEDYELDKFSDANDDLCKTNLKVHTLLAYLGPSMNIVLNVCVVIIIYLGGITVKAGGPVSPGQIIASITYISLILMRIIFMAGIFNTFTRAKASWERIDEVLQSKVIHIDGNKKSSKEIKGKIEFKNVSFAYPETSENVLNDVSFTLNPGETLAIIGATGSGKSSLINLIPRFYDATSGEIIVDGVNVKDYALKDLRDKIAIVLQKSELYSRTIEANIRWGKEEATPWEIKEASEISQADDFICVTPNGYYTQVTEGGHSLSGGQKQRISIARAVIKNAEILIFDDSTSALDLKTESLVRKELNEKFKSVSKIIIAQRIASVKDADKIIVLDNGSIAQIGSHSELLKTSEIYKDIYNSQLKGDEQ
ncbi:MAG: ABC transporter ATP-binding protein [Clostridia bacterium]|nr:ABC transporter ATP-binding protein [Clostridia bacterium]